jgi:hypothetical protein
MGIFPVVFLKPMEPAVRKIVEQVQFAQPVQVERAPTPTNREDAAARSKQMTDLRGSATPRSVEGTGR